MHMMLILHGAGTPADNPAVIAAVCALSCLAAISGLHWRLEADISWKTERLEDLNIPV